MYGTIAKLSVKPGEIDQLSEAMRGGREEPEGMVGGYLLQTDADPNTAYMVAIFTDKQTYLKNADDPAQDEAFKAFRAHLTADPEWNDGTITGM